MLEEKAAHLLEEKEQEFAEMKELARQDREIAVQEAMKVREGEFLEEMHAHVASARAESDQAIARARAEVGLERQRLQVYYIYLNAAIISDSLPSQDQNDARVLEAYKEAELKYNESMSQTINDLELARRKAEVRRMLVVSYISYKRQLTTDPRMKKIKRSPSFDKTFTILSIQR